MEVDVPPEGRNAAMARRVLHRMLTLTGLAKQASHATIINFRSPRFLDDSTSASCPAVFCFLLLSSLLSLFLSLLPSLFPFFLSVSPALEAGELLEKTAHFLEAQTRGERTERMPRRLFRVLGWKWRAEVGERERVDRTPYVHGLRCVCLDRRRVPSAVPSAEGYFRYVRLRFVSVD